MSIRYKHPKGDVWKLDIDDSNYILEKKFTKLDFSLILNEEFKRLVKAYIWVNFKSNFLVPSTLYKTIQNLKQVDTFLVENDIISLDTMTNNEVDLLISFLNTTTSKYTNKPFGQAHKRHILSSFKGFIRFVQMHYPQQAPKGEIFTGKEFIMNNNIKIDFIPDEVVTQIEEALKIETNVLKRNIIIILKETGMRISELYSLKVQYLSKHPVSGWQLQRYEQKKNKLTDPMPINLNCLKAIREIESHTEEYRQLADDSIKDYLFLHKPDRAEYCGQIKVPHKGTFLDWVRAFCKKHNIIDNTGKITDITNHQFRRTLATDMLSKGTDLHSVASVLGNTLKTTSKYYADIKDKERAEIFESVGIIGDINQINNQVIPDEKEFKWFMENKDTQAKLRNGYCTKPITDDEEICPTYLKMHKCFGCHRYVTTPAYLEEHKKHLVELEEEIDKNATVFGDHFVNHYQPTVEILRDIIIKLEELQNGQES
ncbi:site-specific integrase [Bacillaceae bacterium IKA-2]|nr:site-specific integrase [Bacillaceae bacterium IKA-2]